MSGRLGQAVQGYPCSYTHELWREMVGNCSLAGPGVGSFNTSNTQQAGPCTVTPDWALAEVNRQAPPDAVPAMTDCDTWSFLPPASSTATQKSIHLSLAVFLSLFVKSLL